MQVLPCGLSRQTVTTRMFIPRQVDVGITVKQTEVMTLAAGARNIGRVVMDGHTNNGTEELSVNEEPDRFAVRSPPRLRNYSCRSDDSRLRHSRGIETRWFCGLYGPKVLY